MVLQINTKALKTNKLKVIKTLAINWKAQTPLYSFFTNTYLETKIFGGEIKFQFVIWEVHSNYLTFLL